ncbi:FMN-dependent alpha-hydroxy acid dehydrogenase [Glonium stellatum]|uniref:FMN-dependent alpha-hydroxy acid dehydrogenase n=1 Tax=Glonium stellatum TaxID=574774 RepID=A0A8E2JNP7_9PEZI|nr:FMN-dependent alpha-hydroxy acid dehydrogenase [Glonium stellatum]
MAAIQKHHKPHPEARKYGAYQSEIYKRGMFDNIVPTVTTNPNQLEAQAKEAMTSRGYNYAAGGAGERATMDANRLAFRQWKFIPRMLRPTTHRDIRTTIFGVTYDSPLLIAPIGVQTIFHEDRELGVAEIAAELGMPYIMSTAASSSIEEVAQASGDGPRWFQLYWPQEDEITLSILSRARKCNFSVLIVTLDTWALSWRPWDLDAAYVPFMKGIGDSTGFTDPAFRRIFQSNHPEHKSVDEDVHAAALDWQSHMFSGKAHTWDQLQLLRDNWKGPIVLKGIQHVDDARKAVEAGMDGIIVSNHGGRQLDGAIGSLEVLPEIVDAVGKDITVLFDSGVRTGVDVIKALCLGAKGVCIGRPWVYGLGIAGKAGAKEVLQGILADLDQSMGLAGIEDIAGCERAMLRRVAYGADEKSSN